MASDSQLTPMMAQYRRIKGELPKDALLLFRLGDFYEMFFEDAQAGAQLLNVALTKRGVVPMCGIPFHAANSYISRLLKAGRKVAICEQVEEARPGPTGETRGDANPQPGNAFRRADAGGGAEQFSRGGLCAGKNVRAGAGGSDHGKFQMHGGGGRGGVAGGTGAAASGGNHHARRRRRRCTSCSRAAFPILNGYDDWVFAPETAQFTVRDHFKVASLDGFGLKNKPAAMGAAGAVLHYLTQHLRRDVAHLTTLSCYRDVGFPGAGHHHAAASGDSGAAAPGRAAHGDALRRAEPHGHADGRAAAARLAFATAGRRGRHPAPAGGGADVDGERRSAGKIPRATGAGARFGADHRAA